MKSHCACVKHICVFPIPMEKEKRRIVEMKATNINKALIKSFLMNRGNGILRNSCEIITYYLK